MRTFLVLFAVVALSLWYNLCVAKGVAPRDEPRETEEKTLSPYFFVKSEDPNLDQLPLKSTSATVNVSGVIADVTVVQVYKTKAKKRSKRYMFFRLRPAPPFTA